MRRILTLITLIVLTSGVACTTVTVEVTTTAVTGAEQIPAATETAPAPATEPPILTVTAESATATTTIQSSPNPTPTNNESNGARFFTSESNLIQIWPEPPYFDQLFWVSENDIRFFQEYQYDSETDCRSELWQGFSISRQDNGIQVANELISSEPQCGPQPTPLPTRIPSLPGPLIFVPYQAPDGSVTLYEISNFQGNESIFIGKEEDRSDETLPSIEGWLAGPNVAEPFPLFATRRRFGYRWLSDSNHLLVVGQCYGNEDLGNGIYVIDVAAQTLATVTDNFRSCEGTIAIAPSPDNQYLLYHKGQIATITGEAVTQICPPDQFARSYAWSTDGRYAYAACYTENDSDALWRYELATGERQLLTDQLPIPLEPKFQAMFPSPNGDWLAFIWGASAFSGQEQNGVWLLRLEPME